MGAYSLGPTVWGPTVSRHRCWSQGCILWTGALQSWARSLTAPILQPGMYSLDWGPTVWGPGSHSTDFRARDLFTGLGAYSLGDNTLGASSLSAYSLEAYTLGAYSLKAPIPEPGMYSLDWVPTVWGPTVWGPTVWCLHSGGQQSGGLQSHGSDFGSRDVRIGLRACSLWVYSLGV